MCLWLVVVSRPVTTDCERWKNKLVLTCMMYLLRYLLDVLAFAVAIFDSCCFILGKITGLRRNSVHNKPIVELRISPEVSFDVVPSLIFSTYSLYARYFLNSFKLYLS